MRTARPFYSDGANRSQDALLRDLYDSQRALRFKIFCSPERKDNRKDRSGFANHPNKGHGMWAGTSLCYTNGHHHEMHIAVRALFACASNRGPTNNYRADCESNRSSYAAGKASAQRASAYLWRAECRSLLFRRRQEAELSVVAWRCEMRPDFHHEH